MSNFLLTPHTPLRILGRVSLPVRNALRDLQSDWYKVFSYPLLVLTDITGENKGPEIVLDLENVQLPLAIRPRTAESYAIYRRRRQLILAGADTRGIIYAIYRFCRDVLDVDPLWYFNDFLPEKRSSITLPPQFCVLEHSPAFRYRGWFINDEDILSGFFHNETFDGVMSPEGFNRIMEALLRTGGNMIVPGSFAMPDEDVRRLAAARGLILNDHHVTPLGLNMYRWPENEPFSYSRGKDKLRAYWKTCIDTIKDYEQVWTVSFRGKNDHPYWQEDEFAPATDEERAAEIGEAINTQIRMIREVCPDAVISFNMYNEQAKFYRRGLIELPADVIRVWPGVGCFDETEPVHTSAGDGVYYHLTGAARNRYTEHKSPWQIFEEIGRYYRVGANSFCLFNVSNLRHLAVSTAAGMDFLWNADRLAAGDPKAAGEAWLRRYARSHYGDAGVRVAGLYRSFYNLQCLHPLPEEEYIDCRTGFGYQTDIFDADWPFLFDLKQNTAMQGICKMLAEAPKAGVSDDWLTDAARFRKVLLRCSKENGALLSRSRQLEPEIPARARQMYLTQVLTQQRVFLHGTEALRFACDAALAWNNDPARAKVLMNEALREEETLLDALHAAEYGKWATWYETERFACAFYTRDLADNVVRIWNGEAPHPVRYVGGYKNWLYFWDQLYAYQHGCNFPLLK